MQSTRLISCCFKLMLSGSALAGAAAAQAQADPAQPEGSTENRNASGQPAGNAGSPDIIVTAQRREQRLQDVPISVTAISGQALGNSGIISTEQIPFVTPGYLVGRQRRNANPYIRGVGTQASGAGIEPAVPVYVDGVYIFGSGASLFHLNNIERVEVIRGPQGTLFGRNSTGGLVSITTRQPEVDPSIEGTLSYGNFETIDGTVYLTGGSGNVAVDFAGYFISQGKGYGTNLVNGQDINVQDEISMRSRLLWTPSADDRINVTFDWSRDQSTFGISSNVVPGAVAVGGATFQGSPYDAQADYRTGYNQTAWGASLRWEHNFGRVNLTVLSAYRKVDSLIDADVDDTPVATLTAHIPTFDKMFQNEIILNGSLGQLDFTVGVFVLNGQSGFNPQSIRSPTILAQNTDNFSTLDTRSYAGFAQGTYRLGSNTNLTAGIRYTIDQLDFNGRLVAAPGHPSPAGTVLFSRSEQQIFSRPTWRLSLDHNFTADVMAYVSYNRGFKSGTFSVSNPTQPVVRPESLDAIEGGLRTEFANRRVRFNVSGFHYWASDMQLSKLSVAGGSQQLLNAAEARFYGGEMELSFRPQLATGTLQLNTGAAFLHGRYISFPGGPIAVPRPPANGGNTIIFGDLSGNTTVRSPKFTFNASADYSIPVGSNELSFNVTYYHNSGFFWEPDNRIRQSAFDIVDAQIAYSFGSENQYRLRLWGRNLTNQVYYSIGTAATFLDKQTAERPRTYGAAFDFRF